MAKERAAKFSKWVAILFTLQSMVQAATHLYVYKKTGRPDSLDYVDFLVQKGITIVIFWSVTYLVVYYLSIAFSRTK